MALGQRRQGSPPTRFPPTRVLHESTVCPSEDAQGMHIVFFDGLTDPLAGFILAHSFVHHYNYRRRDTKEKSRYMF